MNCTAAAAAVLEIAGRKRRDLTFMPPRFTTSQIVKFSSRGLLLLLLTSEEWPRRYRFSFFLPIRAPPRVINYAKREIEFEALWATEVGRSSTLCLRHPWRLFFFFIRLWDDRNYGGVMMRHSPGGWRWFCALQVEIDRWEGMDSWDKKVFSVVRSLDSSNYETFLRRSQLWL